MATEKEKTTVNAEKQNDDTAGKKKNSFFSFYIEKLLFPTCIALVGIYVTSYIGKQNYYKEVVEKYNNKLKELLVSDKFNLLKAQIDTLTTDQEIINEAAINQKLSVPLSLDLSKKQVADESYVGQIGEGNDNRGPITIITESQKELLRDYIKAQLESKNNEFNQLKRLISSSTANTLLTLNENDSLFPFLVNIPILNSIPTIKPNNPERIDRMISTLRLSGLGFLDRKDGENPLKMRIFLEDIAIGNDSLRSEQKINLDNVDFSLAILNNSSFQRTYLRNTRFNHAELTGAFFSDVILNGAEFSKAEMRNTTIMNSSLENVSFDDAVLDGARFNSAWIANNKNKSLKKQVCSGQGNQWFSGFNQASSLCNMTNLRKSSFKEASLIGVELRNAYLAGSNLTNANLTNADLTNANLTNADLTNANLTGANLTGANLTAVKGFKLDEQKTLKDILIKMPQRNNIRLCNTSSSYDERSSSNPVFVLIDLIKTLFKLKDAESFVLFDNCENANLSNKTLNLSEVNGISSINWENANMTNAIIQMNLSDKLDKDNNKINDKKLKEIFKGTKFCNTLFLLNSQAISDGLGIRISNNCKDENLSDRNLSGNLWENVDLTNASLENSILDIDIKGLYKAKLCNTILPNGIKSFKNCEGASLSYQRLKGLNLKDVNLKDANLSNVDLSGANLTNTKLSETDLTSANLENSILDTNSLNKVKNLCNTILPDGNKSFKKCQDADLTKADLTNPDLTKADLTNADLSTVKGLELQQLEKAILCHTKLPAPLSAPLSAQNIENRDCPKK